MFAWNPRQALRDLIGLLASSHGLERLHHLGLRAPSSFWPCDPLAPGNGFNISKYQNSLKTVVCSMVNYGMCMFFALERCQHDLSPHQFNIILAQQLMRTRQQYLLRTHISNMPIVPASRLAHLGWFMYPQQLCFHCAHLELIALRAPIGQVTAT